MGGPWFRNHLHFLSCCNRKKKRLKRDLAYQYFANGGHKLPTNTPLKKVHMAGLNQWIQIQRAGITDLPQIQLWRKNINAMLLTLAFFGYRNLVAIFEFCEIDRNKVEMPIHAYAVTGDRTDGWIIENPDGTTYKVPSEEARDLMQYVMRITWINWELTGSDTLHDYGCHTAPASHSQSRK